MRISIFFSLLSVLFIATNSFAQLSLDSLLPPSKDKIGTIGRDDIRYGDFLKNALDNPGNIPTGIKITWTNAQNGNIPQGAFASGFESQSNGTKASIYTCRAYHEGNLLPGRITQGQAGCYLSWQGQELSAPSYQVMMNP